MTKNEHITLLKAITGSLQPRWIVSDFSASEFLPFSKQNIYTVTE